MDTNAIVQNNASAVSLLAYLASEYKILMWIFILTALVGIMFLTHLVGKIVKKLFGNKTIKNLKLFGQEVEFEDTSSNNSKPLDEDNDVDPCSSLEQSIENIAFNVQYNKIISITRDIVKETVDSFTEKQNIQNTTTAEQISHAATLVDNVMVDIKNKFEQTVIAQHKSDPSFFLGADHNVYKFEHYAPKDFKIAVTDMLANTFNKTSLYRLTDIEISEEAQRLSKTAINSLRDAFNTYMVTNNQDLINSLGNSEQQLKDAIDLCLRKGKELSVNSQQKIKEETIRHNEKINKIISEITDGINPCEEYWDDGR